MYEAWDPAAPGMLVLPSCRLVRGRALSRPLPAGPLPTYGLYLLGRQPERTEWPADWLRWPDFRLPRDRQAATSLIEQAWHRLPTDRVEIACGGGRGRTGTVLACLVAVDTGTPAGAVDYVREHYDRRAVETPAQRRYVAHFLD